MMARAGETGVSLCSCQAISRVDIDEFGDAHRLITTGACAAETEASTRPAAVVAPLAGQVTLLAFIALVDADAASADYRWRCRDSDRLAAAESFLAACR